MSRTVIVLGAGMVGVSCALALQKRGLEDNVELLGWLDQQQLLEQYRMAQLFLHPSEKTKEEDQEGIPNSMLEAMATLVPGLGWLLPIPFYFMELLVGLVQAMVFMLLTAVFTLLICQHEEGGAAAHG